MDEKLFTASNNNNIKQWPYLILENFEQLMHWCDFSPEKQKEIKTE